MKLFRMDQNTIEVLHLDARLSKRRAKILKMVNEGQTLTAIGKKFDLSIGRVKAEWQKAIGALRSLREPYEAVPASRPEGQKVSRRLENLLKANGLSVQEACRLTDKEFLALRNAGKKSLRELRDFA